MFSGRIGEILGIVALVGILVGIPFTIFVTRDTAAMPDAADADAVIMLSGRNDGKMGQEGDWFVEYANVPIHKDDEGIPIIHIQRGQRVIFRVTGKDVTHGFAIEEYGIDVVVHPGTYEDVAFVADKSGEFMITCSVFCGLGHHGMTATLVVEE